MAIQGLRVRAPTGFDALVRIDDRAAEAARPFQFDAARGILHRHGCRAIPPDAPLLGLDGASEERLAHACKRCKPVPDTPPDAPPKSGAADRGDVLFGLVSLVDQFAGVLRERGKDYRQTADGQHLGTQLKEVYEGLGAREREIVDVVLSTLEQTARRLRSLDDELKRTTAKGKD